MKNNNKFLIIALFIGAWNTIVSCEKEDIIDANDKNTVAIEFDNRVGAQKLALGTTTYKNSSNEEFTVTKFNYFISNISLKKDDGTVVKFPNDYFLVRQEDTKSLLATLKDVPAGNYKELSFIVGVDSTRSVSDVSLRTGVLDPTSYGDDGMYWSWNSGYIFMKLEGVSSVVPAGPSGIKAFQIHVGGYGGKTAVAPNNIRTITLPIATTATVRKNIAPELHLIVDVAKVFDGANKIQLATTNSIHNPAAAKPVADNYTQMFLVDHVHNEKE